MDAADLVVINTCAIREAAEAKVIGRQGELAKLKSANPSMRVVMTGCAVREMDFERLDRRFPAVDLFLRPDQEPELVDRLGLASAQGPVGLTTQPQMGSIGATTIVGRTQVGVADHLAGTRAAAVAGDAVHRHSSVSAWLPIIYGCDKTCTYCIVPFSRGPERSRPFDEIVDEARTIAAQGFREVTLLGQNVNSVRARPRAGSEIRPRPHRTLGGPPARPREPPRPRGAHSRNRWSPDGRREPGDPASPVHHLAPVGPLGPVDRGDGRLPIRLRSAPPARAVRRRRRPQAHGPPVHDRPLPRATGPRSAPPSRTSRSRPTSSSASAARPRRSTSRRSACSSASATTRSSRPPTPSGPGPLRRGSRTTCRRKTSGGA